MIKAMLWWVILDANAEIDYDLVFGGQRTYISKNPDQSEHIFPVRLTG